MQGVTLIYEGNLNSASIGGGHVHFVGLSKALSRALGYKLGIVLPHYTGLDPLPGLPPAARKLHLRAGRKNGLGLLLYELQKCFFYLRHALRCGGQRPILLTRLYMTGLSTLVARVLRFPVILEVNGLYADEMLQRGYGPLMRLLVNAVVRLQFMVAHQVVAVTPGIAAAVGERCSAPVAVIPNGADLDMISVKSRPRHGRPRQLLFVGALAPWQDIPLLLSALERLVQTAEDQTWQLRIAGAGEEEHRFKELCTSLGLDSLVTWEGWCSRERIDELLSSADVCLAPLRSKSKGGPCGSPLKLFEYLASNRPTVAADVDGVRELDLPLLYMYHEGQIPSLLAALGKASCDQGLADDKLSELRERISWDARAGRLLDLAKNLGTKRRLDQGPGGAASKHRVRH